MSPQEYNISVTGYGKDYVYYEKHRRFFRIFERCVDGKVPFVDIQRARYFTARFPSWIFSVPGILRNP